MSAGAGAANVTAQVADATAQRPLQPAANVPEAAVARSAPIAPAAARAALD
jgi:hypothetical protein